MNYRPRIFRRQRNGVSRQKRLSPAGRQSQTNIRRIFQFRQSIIRIRISHGLTLIFEGFGDIAAHFSLIQKRGKFFRIAGYNLHPREGEGTRRSGADHTAQTERHKPVYNNRHNRRPVHGVRIHQLPPHKEDEHAAHKD